MSCSRPILVNKPLQDGLALKCSGDPKFSDVVHLQSPAAAMPRPQRRRTLMLTAPWPPSSWTCRAAACRSPSPATSVVSVLPTVGVGAHAVSHDRQLRTGPLLCRSLCWLDDGVVQRCVDNLVTICQLQQPLRYAVSSTPQCPCCLFISGARTARKVNPLAWDKGLVLAQCGGCEVWHKLRDAGGLVQVCARTHD